MRNNDDHTHVRLNISCDVAKFNNYRSRQIFSRFLTSLTLRVIGGWAVTGDCVRGSIQYNTIQYNTILLFNVSVYNRVKYTIGSYSNCATLDERKSLSNMEYKFTMCYLQQTCLIAKHYEVRVWKTCETWI